MTLHDLIVEYCQCAKTLQTAINADAQMKMNDIVQSLTQIIVADPACLNAKNSDGNTPIHIAVNAGNEMMVRFLKFHHADFEIEDANHNSPFECALNLADNSLATLLASWGADIERKKTTGTLLHSAIRENNLIKAKLLLFLGADCQALAPSPPIIPISPVLKKTIASPGPTVVKNVRHERKSFIPVQPPINYDALPKIFMLTFMSQFQLSREWWELFFSYGLGINVKIKNELYTLLLNHNVFQNKFLYECEVYCPGNLYTRKPNKKSENFTGSCFTSDELRQNVAEGHSHRIDAYIRVLKKSIIENPDVTKEKKEKCNELLSQLSELSNSQKQLSLPASESNIQPLRVMAFQALLKFPNTLFGGKVPVNELGQLQDSTEKKEQENKLTPPDLPKTPANLTAKPKS